MSLPEIVGREEWLAARKDLLAREKAHTRARDALAADRRRLPMVRVEKPYVFEGPAGPTAFADVFEGRGQLIVQHVMFDPEWDAACPSCTAGVDELSDALIRHLAERDTTYALVARAPYEKVAAYRAQRGWTLPFYSSSGSDFNYDYDVSIDASRQPVRFNFREGDELAAAGQTWLLDGPSEQPGVSCFLKVGDEVFHTYSAYARGVDFGGVYGFLDLTALGRQEEWEEPKGRVAAARPSAPVFET
jgi:predicted dithiol-disulfide oxidoreductase (DUF899 family)